MIKKFKNFQVNEDLSAAYGQSLIEPLNKEEQQHAVVSEEEEAPSGLKKVLEKCIQDAEQIVSLFEKDDKKLIDLTLPILDLCQTNLNFLEKKSEGQNELLQTSKNIIKSHVELLKKSYGNNDPVMNLVNACAGL